MNAWHSILIIADAAARSSDGSGLARAINNLREAAARAPKNDLPKLAGVAAMHELPWVRLALLQALVARDHRSSDVRELVGWLTHDYEDFVAFAAVEFAGLLRLDEVLADLFVIVGRASQRTSGSAGKPVGIGHAVVLRAITAIIGSEDPAAIATVEADLFSGGIDSQEYPSKLPRDATSAGTHDHAGMVPIPAGLVMGGPPPSFDVGKLVFDWNDPIQIGSCGDFWMDVLPVSNSEYDAFANSSAAQLHTFCHPDEPKGKLHLRNTLLDLRSKPDHPVTGVDWFDAYAYARAQGKRLPTEAEWQRAGQGDDQRAYPWGNSFDPARARCLPAPAMGGWDGVISWRADLLAMTAKPPVVTSAPRGIRGSESPFGVKDLSGSVWEWTSSSFDGPPFSPVDTDRDAIDLIYDQRSYVVIKGGTWTSLPEQVSVAFRGRDLAFDRHFEIGFRCVCSCP